MSNCQLNYVSRLFCVGLLWCFAAHLTAQTNESGFKATYSMVPKSPEAASLIKFIDFPISYYTGTPDIGLPIASFDEYEHVSASVSLSYHASGNRVNEIAECVGLGWRLNAGGMITRQVYGIPDDASHCQGFLTFRSTNTYASVLSQHNTGNAGALEEYALNIKDTEPDEFYFSFNGYSGKFAFDWTGALPVLSTSSPIKISSFTQDPGNNRITSWELIDGFGVKYLFSAVELTTVGSLSGSRLEGTCNGPHAYASAWHLTKITSPNSAYFIDFQYDDYGYTKQNQQIFETCTTNSGNPSNCPNYPTYPNSNVCHDISGGTIGYSISGKRLKKIINSTGKFEIEVVATVDRTDHPGTGTNFKRVESVVLKHSGQLFTRTNFEYLYQGGRLMLKSLEEEGINGEKLPKTQFTYNAGNLQAYDSKAIDHWGYQNGNTSNKITPFFFANFGGQVRLIPGADRSPQLSGTKSQVLEKVTFPNGGYTEYEYEQNECSYIQGTTVESKQQYGTTAFSPAVSAAGTTSSWTISEQQITISNFEVVAGVSISGSTWAYYQAPTYAPRAYIKNSSGTIIHSWQLGLADFSTCPPPCAATINASVLLPPGTYTIGCQAKKFPDPSSNSGDFISFQLAYNQVNLAAPILKQPVGGLRVKEVRSYDPLTTQLLTKKYQYTDEDNPNYSSGVIYADPINVYARKFVYMPGPSGCSYVDCSYLDIVGTSRVAVGGTAGSHIGYRRVIEIIGTAQDGGKTVMNFASPKEYPDVINTIKPFARPETQSHRTGLMTKSRSYDKNNVLVAQQDIVYQFKEVTIQVPKISFGNYDRGLVSNSTGGQTCADPYELLPASEKFTAWWGLLRMGFAQVSSSVTRKYYGSNYTEMQTTNTYDASLKFRKSTTVKDPALGYEWKSEVTYPWEYACPSACTTTDPNMQGILNMIASNQISVPIEQTAWLKKPGQSLFSLLGAQIIDYNTISVTPAPPAQPTSINIRPVRLNQLFTSTPLTNFVPASRNASNQLVKDSRYTQEHAYGYDSGTGALTEQYRIMTGWDPREQYIWGHEKRLPIAQVVNANANEVAYTSFEEPGSLGASQNGGWTISATGGWNSANGYIVTGKNGYNVGTRTITKSGVPIGKYIVSFWYRDAHINVNGSTVTTAPNANWQYAETVVNLTAAGTITVTGATGSSYIDELRLHPADAQMQTFSYDDSKLLLLSVAGVTSVPIHYEYDNMHRVQAVRDLDRNIRQTTQYAFATPGSALNKVTTRSIQEAISDFTTATTSGSNNIFTQINYFDGLGRANQSVLVGLSPTDKDIVAMHQYDLVGRMARYYIPYTATTNGGTYRTNAMTDQVAFTNTYGAGGYGYSETQFDQSPLNRSVAEGAPGLTWHLATSNKVTAAYRANTAADAVRNFFGTSDYAANALNVVEGTDENGKKAFSFVDPAGRVIMTKQQVTTTITGVEDNDYARTYSIYDDYGRVVAVIPPETAKLMKTSNNWDYTNATYANRIYRYVYDQRGRMVSRTVPSAGTSTVVYDRLDRPVLSTDANGFKVFTRFDILGRPVVVGKYKGTGLPSNTDPLFETPNTVSTTNFYTSTSFPTDNNLDVYKVFYYDDYDFNNDGDNLDADETYTNPAETPYATTAHLLVRGSVTATKVGILKNDGTAPTTFLQTRSYVDRLFRPIQINKQNHLNGRDIINTGYLNTISGRVTNTRRTHTATPPNGTAVTHNIRERYTYDKAGRIRFVQHKINSNNWVVTNAPLYDELGRIIDNRLHASNYDGISTVTTSSSFNFLQSVDYTYNIRGWVTGINDPTSCATQAGDNLVDMFRMSLTYDNTSTTGATAQYNGNISSIQWNTHINGTCGTRQLYRFSYDGANRLTAAAHRTWSGTAWTDPARYNESNITYDLNGNLKSYTRQGLISGTTYGTIDQLTYTYDATRPDRLISVTDAGSATKGFRYNATATTPHYVYDAMGNMTQDKHKNMTVAYNYLNLPQQFTVGSNFIRIIYTADGEKITKETESASTTINYVGGIEYLGSSLDAIYHSSGRCKPNGATAFHYDYTLRDHLGNARVVFRAAGTSVTFLEENHYYPYGMVMEGLSTPPVAPDRYKYNGKELNSELGIDLYDYGARWYDPALGRWSVVDPLAELMPDYSGYNYVFGNPVSFVDPFGLSPSSSGVPPGGPGSGLPALNEQIGEHSKNEDRKADRARAEGVTARDAWMNGSAAPNCATCPKDAPVGTYYNDEANHSQWYRESESEWIWIAHESSLFGATIVYQRRDPIFGRLGYVPGTLSSDNPFLWTKAENDAVLDPLFDLAVGAIGGEVIAGLKIFGVLASKAKPLFSKADDVIGAALKKINSGGSVVVAAKEGQTIIGEGMQRVSMEAAKRPGSVILNNMPKFTGTADQVTSQTMTYNRQWILQQMRSGRPILDIGLDATRTNPSIFYQMEQNMMRNYLKLHPNAFQVIKP
jgi:RHS repeat-associated protein